MEDEEAWRSGRCGERSGYAEIKLRGGSYKRGTYLPVEERVFIGTATVDNFYVRSLGGAAVFGKPSGTISEADYELAVRRLLQFQVILILEDLDDGFIQLERLAGWTKPARKKDSHRSFGSGDTTIRFSDEQRARLKEANALDVRLFDVAKRRSARITGALRAEAKDRKSSQPQSWKQWFDTSTTPQERSSCKKRFGAWEEKAKRDKERWLLQRQQQQRKTTVVGTANKGRSKRRRLKLYCKGPGVPAGCVSFED